MSISQAVGAWGMWLSTEVAKNSLSSQRKSTLGSTSKGSSAERVEGDGFMTARQLAWLFVALVAGGAGSACNGTSIGAAPTNISQLQGAGSTFMAPLQKKWREEYQKRHPNMSLTYKMGTRFFNFDLW